jgi:hypothetical protein
MVSPPILLGALEIGANKATAADQQRRSKRDHDLMPPYWRSSI